MVARPARDGGVPRTLNNFTFTAGRHRRRWCAGWSRRRRSRSGPRIPGLDPRRADIILAGALILEQVVHELGVEELTFSDYALREGVLLDTWRRVHGGSLHHLSDLRRRSVLHLADLMDEDPAHSAHVARLALELFDATADRHGLGDDSREVLEAAALLANVGLFVSHAGHHKHSYYVIRNSERSPGSPTARSSSSPRWPATTASRRPGSKHPEFAALDRDDQRRVRVLAGLLRVAVGLDRNHAARVSAVSVRSDGDGELVIGAVPADGLDVSLELHAAAGRSELLADALGVGVEVVEVGAGTVADA